MPIVAVPPGGPASRVGGGDQSALTVGRLEAALERGYHPLGAAYSRACAASVSRRLAEHRLVIRGGLDNPLAEYDELEALHGHHR